MRVITFKERFAEPVRSGAKRQTIRKSAGCEVGDILSLRRWTGRPRRSRQELLRTEPCESVCAITVTDDGVSVEGAAVSAQAMAKADGFADFAEMREFFRKTHGLPFSGYLIRWQSAACDAGRGASKKKAEG